MMAEKVEVCITVEKPWLYFVLCTQVHRNPARWACEPKHDMRIPQFRPDAKIAVRWFHPRAKPNQSVSWFVNCISGEHLLETNLCFWSETSTPISSVALICGAITFLCSGILERLLSTGAVSDINLLDYRLHAREKAPTWTVPTFLILNVWKPSTAKWQNFTHPDI